MNVGQEEERTTRFEFDASTECNCNEHETRRDEMTRSEAKRNEAKRGEAKRNEAKRNEAKRNEAKRNKAKQRLHLHGEQYDVLLFNRFPPLTH